MRSFNNTNFPKKKNLFKIRCVRIYQFQLAKWFTLLQTYTHIHVCVVINGSSCCSPSVSPPAFELCVCLFTFCGYFSFIFSLVLSRNFRFVYSVVASVSLKFTIRTSIFGFYSKNFVWKYFLFAVLFNHVVKFRSEQLSISCVFFYSNNSHVNVSHL